MSKDNKLEQIGEHFKIALRLAQEAADKTPIVWESSNYSVLLHGCGRKSGKDLISHGIPTLAKLEGGMHLIFIKTIGDGGAKHDAGVLAAYVYLKNKGVEVTLEENK